MAHHQYYTAAEALAESGEHSAHYRNVAEGGLAVCKVCNCFEGSLATECPGEPVGGDQQDRIYAGDVDFVDGAWKDLTDVIAEPLKRRIVIDVEGETQEAFEEAFAAVVEELSNGSATGGERDSETAYTYRNDDMSSEIAVARHWQGLAFGMTCKETLSAAREMLCCHLPEEAVAVALEGLEAEHQHLLDAKVAVSPPRT